MASIGSIFIQALCEHLEDKSFELDLVTILTFVSFDVADKNYKKGTKQISMNENMLRKLVKFTNGQVCFYYFKLGIGEIYFYASRT